MEGQGESPTARAFAAATSAASAAFALLRSRRFFMDDTSESGAAAPEAAPAATEGVLLYGAAGSVAQKTESICSRLMFALCLQEMVASHRSTTLSNLLRTMCLTKCATTAT